MCDHARVTRCPWSTSDPLYVRYHDEEWGFPERDSRALFEKLVLDGFQAGLSWLIEGTIANARGFLRIEEEEGGFSPFLWQFVGGKIRRNSWRSLRQVPAETPESQAMSKALRERGFTFVGPTICYAFMQAVGMVDDHLVTCFRRRG